MGNISSKAAMAVLSKAVSTTDGEASKLSSMERRNLVENWFSENPEKPLALTKIMPELLVSNETFTKALTQLGANFGVDYFEKLPDGSSTENRAKALLLWHTVKERGWTDAQFQERLKSFLSTQRFPNWTIADFIGQTQEIKLYSHVWANREQSKDRAASFRMEAYQIDEKILWRYILENENAIEGFKRVFFRGAWIDKGFAAKTQPEPKETAKTRTKEEQEQINFAIQNVELKILVDNLTEKLKKKDREIEKLQEQIARWAREIESVTA